MTRKYFGTDGVRGRVGVNPITPDFVMRLGYAAGRVLAQASLGHITFRHGDLLTLRQQGEIGSEGARYEFRLGNSTLEIEEITCGPWRDLLRAERQRTCQRHRHQRPQSISK